jgi:hypothetical protein
MLIRFIAIAIVGCPYSKLRKPAKILEFLRQLEF